MSGSPWLTIARGDAPLLVSLPHTGTQLCGLEPRLVSPWLARKDTDWWVDQLYDFAGEFGATVVRTAVSRTVIDVNRDPSGVSLYPGQATTELCPTTTFDGEPLYQTGEAPEAKEIAERKTAYFDPYDAALHGEIARLRARHRRIILYDCHSIRSVIPRLFDGELPAFNLGTNCGASADAGLSELVSGVVRSSGHSFVDNGRFKGGWITRSFGEPARGVHALQLELACRTYMREPVAPPSTVNWPTPFDAGYAAPTRQILRKLFESILNWAGR